MKARLVVVDTNVLISAFLSPKGVCRQALDRLAEENAELLFSDATFAEFTSRIVRPKFAKYFQPHMLEGFVSWLSEVGQWHEPSLHIEACRDADDDTFLSLAKSAQADLLISGDQDLLVLHPFDGLNILSPTEFLQA